MFMVYLLELSLGEIRAGKKEFKGNENFYKKNKMILKNDYDNFKKDLGPNNC